MLDKERSHFPCRCTAVSAATATGGTVGIGASVVGFQAMDTVKAIWEPAIDWVGKAFWDNPKQQIYARLPKAMEAMETVIETNRRFEGYEAEVQAIAKLRISFHDWLKLAPSHGVKLDGADLMYIIPEKLLELEPSL